MQAVTNFNPSTLNGKTHPSKQLNIKLYGFDYRLFWHQATATYAVTDPGGDLVICPGGRALFTVAEAMDWIEADALARKAAARGPVLQDWIESTEAAIEALLNWKADLQSRRSHPHVSDAAFMSAIQDLNEAGLMDWADGNPLGLDHLREVVSHA
jgi:hypothetical protein